MKQAN